MKHKKTVFAFALLACLAMVAMVFTNGSLFAKSKATAEVTKIEGAAKAKMGDGKWKPIDVGAKLSSKHAVKTMKKSKVEIQLPDGSILRIAPLSRVRMKSLLHAGKKGKKEASFKIEAGKIWANVSKAIGGEKKFEVETDNAVAGVRGTIFRVDQKKDSSAVVKVYAGSVAVTNAPIYQREAKGVKGKRVQVQGPKQVSKKKWEELVAKAMQEIRIAADGSLAMGDFSAEEDKDDWVAWNQELDKETGIDHE